MTVDELMSLASGVVSSSKNMGFDDNKEGGEKSENEKVQAHQDGDSEGGERIGRQASENSLYATDHEEDDDERNKIQLGPQCTLKEQLEKDKACLSCSTFKDYNFSSSNLFAFVILPFVDSTGRREFEEVEGTTSWECGFRKRWRFLSKPFL